jgi:hypothetical protein
MVINDQAGAAHAVRIGIYFYCKRMSLANVSANTAYKIIGGYGVDSLLSPQLEETSKPRRNHLLIKESLGRTEYLIDMWSIFFAYDVGVVLEVKMKFVQLITKMMAFISFL